MCCTANARVSLEEFLPISRGLAGSSGGEELARDWTGWLSCSRASDRFTARGSGNRPLEEERRPSLSKLRVLMTARRLMDIIVTASHTSWARGGTSWVMSLEARARPAGTSCGPEECSRPG